MTKEQTIGLIMGLFGLLSLYIVIFRPQTLAASRKAGFWIKMIGLTGTRLLSGCLSLLLVIGSILAIAGMIK